MHPHSGQGRLLNFDIRVGQINRRGVGFRGGHLSYFEQRLRAGGLGFDVRNSALA